MQYELCFKHRYPESDEGCPYCRKEDLIKKISNGDWQAMANERLRIRNHENCSWEQCSERLKEQRDAKPKSEDGTEDNR